MFVGLALFLIVKLVIAARRKSDEDAPEPEDLVLLREIRDLLRERG
jgi:large-conductance mechanosensitive channel